MSSVLEEELCLASGVYPVSGRQNSVLSRERVHCPSGGTLCCVRGKSLARVAELCPQSRAYPVAGGRTLSSVKGISSGRVAVLCLEKGVCPVVGWQKSVPRQGYVQCPGFRCMCCSI
ncbi:hypothetical protein TNIN_366621 [Trichonephila inaurata madagascariensis]|uniref:Uncharacterized protein n=1 Tax=Trichonephila inaurata madagascariensis TaxID=2747483 RepID=A0A8X6KIB3_9ARAC|nr:hypothetical protein TNIN_366621 [Trichonephila inaurata madagascariensis]